MQPTRSILLAEEDAVTRAFLADNLTADGYRVLVADDKPAALELLERSRPDLVSVRRQRRHARSARRRPPVARARQPHRARHAADRAHRRRRRARPRALPRTRRRRRAHQAVLVSRAARPHPRAVAPLLRAPRREPHAGRRAHDRPRQPARCTWPTRPSSCRRWSSRCSPTSRASPTRVWTKDELLRDVWGFRSMGRTRTLDSHACRLRNKLAGAGGRYVENVWGVGYRLVAVNPDATVGSAA